MKLNATIKYLKSLVDDFSNNNLSERGSEHVQYRPQNWTHPEPHSVPVEQFLAMLRFEQRDKLTELPIELERSGRDDFFCYPQYFPTIKTGW